MNGQSIVASGKRNRELVPVNGHQLAVSAARGAVAGPRVVFVHGITGDVDFWDDVVPPEIEESMRWATVSLPGHFPSTVPDGFSSSDVSSHFFADSIAAAVRHLFPNERVHLVGWSTGGFSSLATAARFPDLVASVTSVSGFARGKWGSWLGMMQTLARGGPVGRFAFRSGMKGMAINGAVFERIFAAFAANAADVRTNPIFRESLVPLRSRFSRLDFGVMCSLFDGLRGVDATALFANVIAPTLVIGGKDDPVISIEETRHVASAVPNHTLEEIANCGHLFFCEAGERIWPRIIEWIRQHHG